MLPHKKIKVAFWSNHRWWEWVEWGWRATRRNWRSSGHRASTVGHRPPSRISLNTSKRLPKYQCAVENLGELFQLLKKIILMNFQKTVNQANIDVGMTSIDQWIIHCWFVLPNDARGQIIVKKLKNNKNRNNWEKLLQSFYYQ